jgi:hypothetical protein
MDKKLKDAVDTLVAAISEDKSEGSYYYAWQANIAMAIKDEADIYMGNVLTPQLLHQIANDGAKRFLDQLCYQPSPATENGYVKGGEEQ